MVESDSLEVARALNHEIEDMADLLMIVEEVEGIRHCVNVVSFTKCLRSQNVEAHNLARVAVSHKDFEGFFFFFWAF